VTALRALLARRRDDAGVSLAELLVAMMVFGIVITVVSTTFVSLAKATSQARSIDLNTRVASTGLADLTRTIRAARTIPVPGGTETPSFSVATTEALTLTTALNTADSVATVPRKVSFTVQPDRSLVETTVVGASAADYWTFTATATKRVIGGSVLSTAASGTPLFSYVDFSGKQLVPDASGALTATQMSSIAAVRISLAVDRAGARTAQTVTLQNTVSLSNLLGGAVS
jgi:prepilin-type N-terminal cleavage/methylation domain-containing protein